MSLGDAAQARELPRERAGLYDRDPEWAAFEPVMRREWVPYLEHKVDLQTALRQLVAGYVPPASAPGAPAP